jgi:hypothetical protein
MSCPHGRCCRLTPSIALLIAALPSLGARAESPTVTVVEQLSASPDAPVFGFVWRRAPRATLSATLPILGGAPDATAGFRLTPFVEIYNNPGEPLILPNQNWRGRLSAEVWRLWPANGDGADGAWLRGGIAYEHESDHSSVRVDAPQLISAFRTLNDVNFRVSASTSSLKALLFTAELDSRIYLFSCTQPDVDCLDNLKAVTYGGSLELTSQLRMANDWHAFWSLSVSWIVPSSVVVRELRMISHLGFWKRRAGTWQIFALGYIGSDVGVFRETSLKQLGLGVRWAP